ncbi:MAG: lipoyl synthase [Deltaproteobacteria bacterium]|nr:MAG: lipoyl synthase [Deltaproteobacteria bacterium]
MPSWAVNRASLLGPGDGLKRRLRRARLVTVCEEARCPNLGECFGRGVATFMLLGDRCTRRCAFCSVRTGRPAPPDALEGPRVAEAAARLGLRYVVLTSVARDDLEDQGAGAFVAAIEAIRARIAGVAVEVLTPDFGGRAELIGRVVAAAPEVFAHNLETVERLTPEIRGRASYRRSLAVVAEAARRSADTGMVKSGLMVGLGETREEISRAMRDLRDCGCQLLTVGQYLRPTRRQRPVSRYLSPQEFAEIEAEARALGFAEVACGPLVRSSYRAEALYGGVGRSS